MAHSIPELEMTTGSNRWGLSWFWDVTLPLGVAGVPTAVFLTIGWLIGDLDAPGKADESVIWWMLLLQPVGIAAMGVVALLRYEIGLQQLATMFPGGVAEWRRLCLFLGVVCLTLFDAIANVCAMFAGTELGSLFLVGVPFYLAYLMLIRIGLWRQMA